MKKYFLFLFICLASFSMQSMQVIDYQKKTPTDMLQVLTGAHIRTFGLDDLLSESLVSNTERIEVWKQTVDHIKNYVEYHIKNFFGTKNAQYMDALSLLLTANRSIIVNVEDAYRYRTRPVALKKYANALNNIASELRYVGKLIAALPAADINKQNARTVLQNFAFYLEITAETAQKHINKYMV